MLGEDRGIGESLKRQAQQVGIQDHIRWLGATSEVFGYLVAADIAILVSHQEGLVGSPIFSLFFWQSVSTFPSVFLYICHFLRHFPK